MRPRQGFSDLGFAKIDTDRLRRRGRAEAVFCPGKTLAQLKEISQEIIRSRQYLLLTRLEAPAYAQLKKSFPALSYAPAAKIAYLLRRRQKKTGLVAVISAGTADMPVAEEAAVTLEIMGSRVERVYDVGVAGVHRLMRHLGRIRRAKVVVVVAGMEGALAS